MTQTTQLMQRLMELGQEKVRLVEQFENHQTQALLLDQMILNGSIVYPYCYL